MTIRYVQCKRNDRKQTLTTTRSFFPPFLFLFGFPVTVFVSEHGHAIGAEPGLGQGRFKLDTFEMELPARIGKSSSVSLAPRQMHKKPAGHHTYPFEAALLVVASDHLAVALFLAETVERIVVPALFGLAFGIHVDLHLGGLAWKSVLPSLARTA